MRHALTPESQVIARLLAAKGIDHYALFLTQREQRQLPGGLEVVSGYVLQPGGAVHGFWLDWDEAHNDYVLNPWFAVPDPEQAFAEDTEYHAAHQYLHDNHTASRHPDDGD